MVTAVAMADWSFDPARSSRSYWRTKCCLFAIQNAPRINNITKNTTTDRPFKPYNIGDNTAILDTLEDSDTPESILEQLETINEVNREIDRLPNKQSNIIRESFFNRRTQASLAKYYGVSQPRISHIIQTACNTLRKRLAHLNG
jgi:RNA polymerase sigma factor (sigma-70 family)